MIAKGYMPLSIMESPCLRQMVLHLCDQVQFSFHKWLVYETFSCSITKKTLEVYVLPTIGSYAIKTTIFDLGMSSVHFHFGYQFH